jgi:hypothetical protein
MTKTIKDLITSQPLFSYHTSKLYKSNFKDLIAYTDLDIPDIQVDQNKDKIYEIKNKYIENPHFFLAKSLITIAILNVGDITKYYLIDGQHRYEAIKEIVKSTNTNEPILISTIYTKTKIELIKLFKELNMDSMKTPQSSLFSWIINEKLKEKLLLEFKSYLPKNNDEYVYTINQFIDHIMHKKYIKQFHKDYNITDLNILEEDIDDKYVNDIYEILLDKNKEFFDKFDYISKHQQNGSFRSKEKKLIEEKKNCMFFKKNNFFQYLKNPKLELLEHEGCCNCNLASCPYCKNSIPALVKKEVWKEHYGDHTNAKCPIYECKNIMDINVNNSWHTGHIKSRKNGGPTKLDNLKPLCQQCNNSMGGKNWNDYEDELIRKILIDLHFDHDESIKCRKTGCKNRLNKENFYYIIDSKNKPRVMCQKCSVENNTNKQIEI